MPLFRLGPSGGPGGTNTFDDFEPVDTDVRVPPDISRVVLVEVAALKPDEDKKTAGPHPGVIHGIRVQHIVDSPADSFFLEQHGQFMTGRNPHQVTVPRGQHIKRIEGKTDITGEPFVTELRIGLGNQSGGDVGDPILFGQPNPDPAQRTEFKYEAPTGFAIVGFFGREGTLIDAIGVILRPL